MNTPNQENDSIHLCEVCGSELNRTEHVEHTEPEHLVRLQILKSYE